jgi:capsular polysaccharide export protein
MFRPRPTSLAVARGAAADVLFPELAGGARARLTQGLLRAPRRGGRAPAPLLSALPRDGEPASAARVLADRGWENPDLLARAAAARRALVTARIGGAWWHDGPSRLPPRGDYALVALAEPAGGTAGAAMLDRAFNENPAERIVIAAPERIGRVLRARLAAASARGAVIVKRPFAPWAALDRAGRVYSVGGEIGFLALLAGVPVTAFADAFYTGWGATEDAAGRAAARPFRRSVDEIFAGACLIATRYRDPFRNIATSCEEVLAIVADWRRLEEANRTIAVCVGMSFWKRRRVAAFVRSTRGIPPFRRTVDDALTATAAATEAAPGAIAGWASRLPDGLAAAAARRGAPLIRVEDGFIRSVGLGSDFLPPASLVFDNSGMYYDPRSDSDLHRVLRDTAFDAALLARAERLIAQLVARGVTKYNLAAGAVDVAVPADRRRILVPGQVEDDLSIVFGAGTVRSNLALLAEVRQANPDAFIFYKPHPDVQAGHRAGAVPEDEARRFADVVMPGGSLAALLTLVDELHTMTSLAGFEALLRGRRVVAYGRPFYAGWGLTDDRPEFDRGRRLSLAELVAGALILYPRYLDPLTRLPCGPEVIIERLDRPELWRPGPLVLARRLQGWAMRRLGERRGGMPSMPLAAASPARRLRARPRP